MSGPGSWSDPDVSLEDLLLAHTAGQLPPPLELIVGTHLALSPSSRQLIAGVAMLGGATLEREEPAALAPNAWDRLRARLDAGEGAPPKHHRPAARATASRLPRPLRDHLPGGSLEALPWRRYGSATVADLELGDRVFRTSLVNVRAGRAFPRHNHAGTEFILVVEGGFSDESGHYRPGDLTIAGPGIEHQPVADPDRDWLWLRVLDAPLRPLGAAARFRRI